MKIRFSFFLFFVFAMQVAFGYQLKHSLRFKTADGHVIKVANAKILYDNRVIFKRKYDDDILYDSKSNRVIEDHGSIFLFLAIGGGPNLDRLNAFQITSSKAILVADAILSPIKDYDGDGYLEFGGRDLTEMYPNPDSMYYIPTEYYEIRDGEINLDKELTRSKDIAINGRYLPRSKRDDSDGFCCVVIPTPGKKHHTKQPVHSDLIVKSYMGSDTISVYATKDVLNHNADVNFVVHNYNGLWYFYSNVSAYKSGTPMEKAKLADLIKIDKTVLLLSWVEKGRFAERTSKPAPWGSNLLENLK